MTRAEILKALKELGELRSTGILTEEEFQHQKKFFLDQLRHINDSPIPQGAPIDLQQPSLLSTHGLWIGLVAGMLIMGMISLLLWQVGLSHRPPLSMTTNKTAPKPIWLPQKPRPAISNIPTKPTPRSAWISPS